MPAQLFRKIYRGFFRGESYWDTLGMNENLQYIDNHLPLNVLAVDPDPMPATATKGEAVLFAADGTYKVYNQGPAAGDGPVWTTYPASKGLMAIKNGVVYENTGSSWTTLKIQKALTDCEGNDIPGGTAVPSCDDVSSNITTTITTVIASTYPVGSVYINASSNIDPASFLGFGTWVQFGQGRVLVGVDSGDELFNSIGETGGSKDAVVVSHSHGVSDPGHAHTLSTAPGVGQGSPGTNSVQQNFGSMTTDSSSTGISINSTGSSGSNANVQPYITVFMWKRTA